MASTKVLDFRLSRAPASALAVLWMLSDILHANIALTTLTVRCPFRLYTRNTRARRLNTCPGSRLCLRAREARNTRYCVDNSQVVCRPYRDRMRVAMIPCSSRSSVETGIDEVIDKCRLLSLSAVSSRPSIAGRHPGRVPHGEDRHKLESSKKCIHISACFI